MVVTKELFTAYLNCPRKAYLKNLGTSSEQTKLGAWQKDLQNKLRQQGLDFIQKQSPHKIIEAPTATEFLKKASALYFNCSIESEEVRSIIDAVEILDLRVKNTQWLPYRCQSERSADRHDKLLLAYDALCLQTVHRVDIRVGKLVDGANKHVRKVHLHRLLKGVHVYLRQLTELLQQEKEPPPILNKHCVECEFREQCRGEAMKTDDLSLLGKMSLKERRKLQDKGIFTVTQLSYTFRPRRRSKNPHSKPDKFSYPLKALAIRENKIHVAGAPTFTIQDNDCFLDVEGVSNHAFYFLAGVRFQLNGRTIQYSFWANDRSEEKMMWKALLIELHEHRVSRIVHFGSFEKEFLATMNRRYCSSKEESEYVETLIRQSVNLLSVIYSRIYFPTYSNGLKEIAQYLGYQWPHEIRNGYEAPLARFYWESSGDVGIKNSLLRYNTSDCEALELVAHCVSQLCGQVSTPKRNENPDFVDTNKLRRWGAFKFGPLNFVTPDFEYINRAAYWDYQRERIVLRSQRLSAKIRLRASSRHSKYPITREIPYRRTVVCPKCKSRKVYKWGPRSKTVYDLKFSPAGVKRWVLKYRFDRHICWTCRKTFMPPNRPWTRSKYGNGLIRYFTFLIVDLQISQRAARKLINQFFGLDLPRGAIVRFKSSAADFYKLAYKKIVRNIVTGHLAHVDETKVNLNGRSAYVWVLASQENVAYIWSETREGTKIQEVLKKFKGILISDFYGVYDSFKCPQQKCLIHPMRDLNDDLLRAPFNEELKSFVNGFSSLVKPIVETVDRYGLKRRFLRKHKRAVRHFYRWLAKASFETEVGVDYKKRFEKNKEKLFTFMDYDDVPWNNNAAEHAIKAFATLRRVFGSSSSEIGIQDYLVLLSVCETCRYRGINFWDFLSSGNNSVDAYIKRYRPKRRSIKSVKVVRPRSSRQSVKQRQGGATEDIRLRPDPDPGGNTPNAMSHETSV